MEFDIPAWGQQIILLVTMIVAGIVGLYKYFKTEAEKSVTSKPAHKKDDDDIIAEISVADSKILKELIDTLREHQEEIGRHTQKSSRAQIELRDALMEVVEALHVQSSSTTNLLRFLKIPKLGGDQ